MNPFLYHSPLPEHEIPDSTMKTNILHLSTAHTTRYMNTITYCMPTTSSSTALNVREPCHLPL